MAYEKYTWQTGETITAEKLNHIEDGITDMSGGGVLVVNMNTEGEDDNVKDILDKTWQEISDAYSTRGAVVKKGAGNTYTLIPITLIRGNSALSIYAVKIMDNDFYANSPNDYPVKDGVK